MNPHRAHRLVKRGGVGSPSSLLSGASPRPPHALPDVAAAVRTQLEGTMLTAHWKGPDRGVVLWRYDDHDHDLTEWVVHSFRTFPTGEIHFASGDYFLDEKDAWADYEDRT